MKLVNRKFNNLDNPMVFNILYRLNGFIYILINLLSLNLKVYK